MPFTRLNKILKSFIQKPSGSIVVSYITIITIGGLFLMPPYANADGQWLSFLNAIFTSASAICVTGLIVVDTATKFTPLGQIIIMLLIQIGGLGIMVISYFGTYIVNKKTSVKDKLTASLLLDEQDTRKISETVISMIKITFLFELLGTILLFLEFSQSFGVSWKALLFSAFHAVSAFCNAGFALFTNSFETYQSNLMINFVITTLIIAGGISFVVLTDIKSLFTSIIGSKFFDKKKEQIKLSLNTKAVLIATGFLLLSGSLLIYAIEHQVNLFKFDLPTQYLSAYFQSVTLRTAGFNTIPIGELQIGTLLIMILYMYIGGASGSTAGGIKVNTLSVIYAYIKSTISGDRETLLMKHHIKDDRINESFLLAILSIFVVFLGTLLLTFTEPFAFERILFEATSAFGTVGLSTGITFDLSKIGKVIIIVLMYIGRLGPLTLVIALSQRSGVKEVKYPSGKIIIG